MTQYLKKYTSITHLKGILENASLFLANKGNREKWPDKNDIALIDKFIDLNNIEDLGITCMTKGADRHHFWHTAEQRDSTVCPRSKQEEPKVCLWSKQEEPKVCLWFKESSFLESGTNGRKFIKKEIKYKYINALNSKGQSLELSDLPFLKRKQYADEREVRIIEEYSYNAHQNTELKFNKTSLCNIFFDARIEQKELKEYYNLYHSILKDQQYVNVELKQNKLLRHKGWIEAAFNATK